MKCDFQSSVYFIALLQSTGVPWQMKAVTPTVLVSCGLSYLILATLKSSVSLITLKISHNFFFFCVLTLQQLSELDNPDGVVHCPLCSSTTFTAFIQPRGKQTYLCTDPVTAS